MKIRAAIVGAIAVIAIFAGLALRSQRSKQEIGALRDYQLVGYSSETGPITAGMTLGDFIETVSNKETTKGNKISVQSFRQGSNITLKVKADGKDLIFHCSCGQKDQFCLVSALEADGEKYGSRAAMTGLQMLVSERPPEKQGK